MNEINILVITPVSHIKGVSSGLKNLGTVTFIDDPSEEEIISTIKDYEVIFTNPNKSKVYLGSNVLDAAIKLKILVTASTGTNHIDLNYCKKNNIRVLSLTEERKTINRISSTAEHAFALTMASLRNIVKSDSHVKKGDWDL